MKKFALLLLLTLTASSAVADCIFTSRIRGYSLEGRDLILNAGRAEYVADVGICNELAWADEIAFDSSRVCDGDRMYVLNFGRVVDQCVIWSLERRE